MLLCRVTLFTLLLLGGVATTSSIQAQAEIKVSGADLFIDLLQYVGKSVTINDGVVFGADNDGALLKAQAATFKLKFGQGDRETFRFILKNCGGLSFDGSICQLPLSVRVTSDKQGGMPILVDPTAEARVLSNQYRKRSNQLASKNDLERAAIDLEEAIRLDPVNPVAYSDRGFLYQRRGDNQRAMADLNKALSLDSNLAAAYSTRGGVYASMDNREKAMADADQAIRLDPKSVFYSNRGYVLNHFGEYDQAIADLNEALKIDPKNAFAYKNRGVSYEKKSQFEKALADYQQAVSLNPNLREAVDGVKRIVERSQR